MLPRSARPGEAAFTLTTRPDAKQQQALDLPCSQCRTLRLNLNLFRRKENRQSPAGELRPSGMHRLK
jgi:hypothetical protein